MGYWMIEEDILNRIHHCRCSRCNKDPQDYVEGTEDWWLGKLPNYCPTCGENMIEEDNKGEDKNELQRAIDELRRCFEKNTSVSLFNMKEKNKGDDKTHRDVQIDYKDSRNVSLYKYLETLYHTLREIKHRNLELFNSNKYKWKLGIEVANILKICNNSITIQEKTQYLFGIEVKIDYKNPYNVQLYEDITNQIAIELETDQK